MAWTLSAVLLASCRQDMHDGAKLEPYEGSSLFADGRAMRPLVEGTVARGRLGQDEHLERGLVGGKPAETFPFALDRVALLRGKERYGIFCAPCHGELGRGNGVVVQRGVKAPESFHVPRLRQAPPGYYVDVMTRGFGAMFDYSDRIEPSDRWKIGAWIQVLQESQDAPLQSLEASARAALEAQPAAPAAGGSEQ
jgi:hypothetical protein